MTNATVSDSAIESPQVLLHRAIRRICTVVAVLAVLAVAHHVEPAMGVQHAGAEAHQQIGCEG